MSSMRVLITSLTLNVLYFTISDHNLGEIEKYAVSFLTREKNALLWQAVSSHMSVSFFRRRDMKLYLSRTCNLLFAESIKFL